MKLITFFLFMIGACFVSLTNIISANDNQFLASAVAQISTIKVFNTGDKISILRDGVAITAKEKDWICINDRLDVQGSARAKLITPNGSVEIGKHVNRTSWAVTSTHKKQSELNNDFTIMKIFALVTGDLDERIFPEGRGFASDCRESYSTTPIRPLQFLPSGRQRLGIDVNEFVIAWESGTGYDNVLVQLAKSDGTLLFSKRVCNESWIKINVAPGSINVGEILTLTTSDHLDNKIIWEIEIVEMSSLPYSLEAWEFPWEIGVWGCCKAPKEYRIDSISRLLLYSNEFIFPKILFKAIILNSFQGSEI